MCDSVRQKCRQFVALLTCMLLLCSVVIPHHHHQDGTPCCQSIEWEHSQGDETADTNHCGCEGHNLAVLDHRDSYQVDSNHQVLFIPLLTLFDFVNTPKLAFYKSLLRLADAFFTESLYDAKFFSAVGLRAPPMA